MVRLGSIALSVAIGMVAGCQVGHPVAPADLPGPSVPGTATAGTATAMETFEVNLMPAEAGFSLHVFDAYSGERLTAPEGTPTDAAGRARVNVSSARPGSLLRFVATHGDRRFEALHLFDAAARYRTQQAAPIQVVLSAATSVGARTLSGLVKLSAILKPAARETLMVQVIGDTAGVSAAVVQTLAEQPQLAQAMTRPGDERGEALRSVLTSAGVFEQVKTMLVEAVRTIARLAQDPANRVGDAQLPARVVLEGLNLVVDTGLEVGGGGTGTDGVSDDVEPEASTEVDVTLH